MTITERQKELLGLLAQGKAPKEAAFQMGISYQTVKNHIKETRERMEAETTVHAVVMAIREGIICL